MQDVLFRIGDQGYFGSSLERPDQEFGRNTVGNVGRSPERGGWPAKRRAEALKVSPGGN